MYIRNYATNFTPEGKFTTNPNTVTRDRNNQPGIIPVKSFSDSSAYEVFNNIGKKQENTPLYEKSEGEYSDNTEEVIEEIKDDNKEANDEINEKSKVFIENKTTVSSFIGGLAKLKTTLDFDFFILAVLVAVVFFNKETEDKLTPIALLAIMFL